MAGLVPQVAVQGSETTERRGKGVVFLQGSRGWPGNPPPSSDWESQ